MENPWMMTISVSEKTEGLKFEQHAGQIEHVVHFPVQIYRLWIPWKGIEGKEIPALIMRTCASETEKAEA
jgi:hypothetical protein